MWFHIYDQHFFSGIAVDISFWRSVAVAFLISVSSNLAGQESPPAKPKTPAKPTAAAITAKLDRLSDSDFTVRQAAENELWALGPSIEPQLIQREKIASLEAQSRIQRIRERFAMGITADMPESITDLVYTLNDDQNAQKKSAAANALIAKGYFLPVTQFMKRNPAATSTLRLAARSPRGTPVSKAADDYHINLLSLGCQMPKSTGRSIVQQVLYSSYVRTHPGTAWWQRVLAEIEKCPAENRSMVVASLSSIHTDLRSLMMQEKNVAKWIELTGTETDARVRQQNIQKLIRASMFESRRISVTGTAPANIDVSAVFKSLSPRGKFALVDFLLKSPVAISTLHGSVGDKALLDVCTNDAGVDHYMIGQLASITSWPKDKKTGPGIIAMIQKAPSVTARQELIRGYVVGLPARGRDVNVLTAEKQVGEIWQLLTTGKPEQWQLQSLLLTYRSPAFFRKRHSRESLDRMFQLAEVSSPDDLAQLIGLARVNSEFLQQVAQHELQINLLRLLRDHPSERTKQSHPHLLSLAQSDRFGKTFSTKALRKSFIDFCQQEKTQRSLHSISSGLVANHDLLTHLIADGHFDTILDSLLVGEGGSKSDQKYADVTGKFLSARAVVEHLVESQNVDLMLSIKKRGLAPDLTDAILSKIVNSDSAITAIFQAGKWDDVTRLVDGIQDQGKRDAAKQLLARRKAFALHLASQGEVVSTLAKMSKDQNWVRSGLYKYLITNLPTSVAESEPDVAMAFWKFSGQLDSSHQTACMEALLGTSWFLPRIVQQEKWAELEKELKQLLPGTRLKYLLDRSARARAAAGRMKSGDINSVVLLGKLQATEADQIQYYRQAVTGADFAKWILSEGQPDALMRAIESIKDPVHRQHFGFACFYGYSLNKVPDPAAYANQLREHFQRQRPADATLWSLAIMSRADKLGENFRDQDLAKCMKGDIAAAVQFAMKHSSWSRQRYHWANFVSGIRPEYVKDQPELAKKLWVTITPKDKKMGYTSPATEALLRTAWFVPQLRAGNQTDAFLAKIKKDFSKWDRRTMATQYAQSPGIIQELENGSIEFFEGLCDVLDASERDHVLGYIGRYRNLQVWFATSKQPDKIIAAIDSIKDKPRREQFASSLLCSGILGYQPDNKELLPKIFAYSRQYSEDVQLRIATTLLRQYRTDDAAMQTELPEFVMSRLGGDQPVNPQLLVNIIQTSKLFGLIEEKKLQRKIIDQVFAIKDPTVRQGGFQALLRSKNFQAELTNDDITKIFSLSQQLGEKQLGSLLRSEPFIVQRLTEMGKYDAVQRVATSSMSGGSTPEQQWSFYLNSAVVSRERAKKQRPTTLVRLLSDRNPHTLEARLMDLGRHPEAMKWILESYGWKPFGDAINQIGTTRRHSVIAMTFQGTNLFAELAKMDRFEELVKQDDLRDFIVKGGGYVQLLRVQDATRLIEPKLFMDLVRQGYEQSDPVHHRMASRMLQNTEMKEAALKSEQSGWLLKTIQENPAKGSPQDQRADRLKNLTSPRGLLSFAIRAQQFDAAEKMLSEFAEDDRGRLRLIRFQMHRQLVLENQGQKLLLSDAFKKRLQEDKRLAVYWARSQGDYESAVTLAKPLVDTGLDWSLAIESHDWKRLAALPVCKTSELPLQPANLTINPVHRRIEQLGFMATLQQINGEEDASTDLLQNWITQNSQTPNTPRYGADALLTTSEIDKAMRLLDEKHGRRAFYWHRFRLDYAQSLKVLGRDFKTASKIFDQFAGQATGTERNRITAASYVIEVAMALRDAGHADDLAPIMSALRDHADHPKVKSGIRPHYLYEVAKLLHKRGFPEESRKTIAMTDDKDALGRYFAFAFADAKLPGAAAEARVWLDEFRRRHPQETQLQLLGRVDGAMTATTELKALRPFPDWADDSLGSGVPVTRYRYGLYDQAITVVQKRSRKAHSSHVLIGDTRRAEKKYAEAAEAYYDAFRSNPYDLTRLYLAGHCWELAGGNDKANELKLLARSLAISFELNHGLAIGLMTAGLTEDSVEIYRTLVRNAPPSSTAYLQSVRHLAIHATKPAERVERWNEFMLYHLRPIEYYHDLHVWLRSETNWRVSRALLALEQDRLDDARKHYQQAVKINPVDYWPVEQFAAALRDKGKGKWAEDVEKQRKGYLRGLIKQFPNSPVLKTRLAEQDAS